MKSSCNLADLPFLIMPILCFSSYWVTWMSEWMNEWVSEWMILNRLSRLVICCILLPFVVAYVTLPVFLTRFSIFWGQDSVLYIFCISLGTNQLVEPQKIPIECFVDWLIDWLIVWWLSSWEAGKLFLWKWYYKRSQWGDRVCVVSQVLFHSVIFTLGSRVEAFVHLLLKGF